MSLQPDSPLDRINQNAPLEAAFRDPCAHHEFSVSHRNRYVRQLARFLELEKKHPHIKKKYGKLNEIRKIRVD